jgi:signal transduction histidine kinase
VATPMTSIDVDRREQSPPAGQSWIPAVLCAVVALSFAGWTMMISWSVSGPVWWEEMSERLVGVFVVVSGVMMWIRRPTPRMGQLMILCGMVYYFQYLRSAYGLLFIIGFCLAYLWVAVAAHLALAWPTGTLEGRADRVLIICAYFSSVGTQTIRYLVDRPHPPWATHLPQVNTLWAVVGSAIAATMALLTVGRLIHHWVGSTPFRRRPDGPVWMALTVVVTAKIAAAVASIEEAPVTVQATLTALIYLSVIVLIPVLYLIRWLHRKFAHQRVVQLLLDLERNLESLADPAALQRALSRALGDPTLALAYPLEGGEYVDIHGKRVDHEHEVPGRTVTRVHRRGRLVAIIDHDIALQEQRQMTEAAVAATGLAMENARLYATMQQHLDQIRTSRLRLAQTAIDERERIQRDLHDDAQQRFFKVLMLLDKAGRQLDDGATADAAATIQCAHTELAAAVRALRELTHGIYPAVLLDHGLAAAVENLVDRAPLPVSTTVTIRRWPKHVEITAYFVISEALTNIYKHANATQSTVRVHEHNQRLIVEIADDGRGGARPDAGFGLTSLRHRVEGVAGHLIVHSEPGKGTRLVAVFPRSTS